MPALIFSASHLHPMIVHFPIALILIGLVAEYISLSGKSATFYHEASWFLLGTGTVTAIPALLTGMFLTKELTGPAGDIRDIHETWGIITLAVALVTTLASSFVRMKNLQHTTAEWAVAALYTLTAAAVVVTGYYGGLLAYEF